MKSAVIFAAVAMLISSVGTARGNEADFEKLSAEKSPAVVTVKFVLKFKSEQGDAENEGEATGVMIEPDGLIPVHQAQDQRLLQSRIINHDPAKTVRPDDPVQAFAFHAVDYRPGMIVANLDAASDTAGYIMGWTLIPALSKRWLNCKHRMEFPRIIGTTPVPAASPVSNPCCVARWRKSFDLARKRSARSGSRIIICAAANAAPAFAGEIPTLNSTAPGALYLMF